MTKKTELIGDLVVLIAVLFAVLMVDDRYDTISNELKSITYDISRIDTELDKIRFQIDPTYSITVHERSMK